jgi:hypothetical protein
LSKHIALYGTQHGLSVTSGQNNYVANTNCTHSFWGGTQQYFTTNQNGTSVLVGTLTVNSTVYANNGSFRTRAASNAAGYGQPFQCEDASGRAGCAMNCYFDGNYVSGNPEAVLVLSSMNGGWAWQEVGRSTVNSPPTMVWKGAQNAPAFNVTSAKEFKQDVRPVLPQEASVALERMQPVRFRRKPPPKGEGQTYEPVPGPEEYGLLADDIAAPAGVEIDGRPGYSLSAVLALCVQEIRTLRSRVAELEGKPRG